MNKEVKSASIEDIRKLIRKFPGYHVIGNKPYAKGLYLIRSGANPKLIHIFDRNYDAMQVMSQPDFHPEKLNIKKDTLFGAEEVSSYMNPKIISNKIISHLLELQELLPLFEINTSTNTIDDVLHNMRYLHNSVQQ